MDLQTFKVIRRVAGGKGAARQLRFNGVIPGVLYGDKKDPLELQVNLRDFQQLLHGRGGEHAVVNLEFENEPKSNSPALLKSVQHHPIKDTVTHIDFLRIRLDQRITTSVQIECVGQAPGLVEGGVLDHQLREIEIECLALEIPEVIQVDVSGLNLGDSLHVKQIIVPSNITIVTDPERTVVAVHTPRVVKEEVAEVGVVEGEEKAEVSTGDAAKEGA